MNILIIDDNREQAMQLRQLVCKLMQGTVPGVPGPGDAAGTAPVPGKGTVNVEIRTSGRNALAGVDTGELRPDIVLTDIDLGEENGIDVARKTTELLPQTRVIFVSGYDDYYLDVYDVEHIWFLRKPVEEEALKRALGRAVEKLAEGREPFFCYEANRRTHTVPLNNILYMASNGRVIRIHTDRDPDGSTHEFYGRISEVAKQLAGICSRAHQTFFRCHQRYIVNLDRVSAYDTTAFYIEKVKIPVSRRYRDAAEEAFGQMLAERMV